MRASQFHFRTRKEVPADAEVVSHRLMLRAGLLRKLASGLYSWMPMGLRVLRKVEAIVREEMNAAGAQELLMPVVQPAELWQESGRWEQYGPELLRMHDRHEREFCLGPTHEEVVTDIFRNEIKSYKQLPVNFYQIQTKFRDEIRPRFGIMRAREFVMKDAYSFHSNAESLQQTYDAMYAAYSRIFERIGLDYRAVIADTGSIGGNASHEFHVLADSGEDDIAFSDSGDYAANVELAEAVSPAEEPPAATREMAELATPGVKSIDELAAFTGNEPATLLKTLVVKASPDSGHELVALVLRGDHALNEIKAEKLDLVASPLEFAGEQAIRATTGAGPGSLGPVGLSIPCIADRAAAVMADFTAGANCDDKHMTGVNWGRDAQYTLVADIRNVTEGESAADGSGTLSIRRGIEVGHIFQLGDKYSNALSASVLDENGKDTTVVMGCYGIGVSRVVAAAIEQNHDDAGICWPEAIAPFQVSIIPLNYQKSEAVRSASDNLYQVLQQAGIDVLLDDRNERPGVKFADNELIGIPVHIVIGDRGLERGVVEFKRRATGENRDLPAADLAAAVLDCLKS